MVLSLPFGGKGALLTAPLQCGQEPSGRKDGRFSATLRAEGGTHRPCAECIGHPEATQGEGYTLKLVEGEFCEVGLSTPGSLLTLLPRLSSGPRSSRR